MISFLKYIYNDNNYLKYIVPFSIFGVINYFLLV